jgi:uncharacterized membrane protein YebE (DUF533 family)
MKKISGVMAITFLLSITTASAQQTTVETKKGMSQPAKGAVIGAAAGAGTGLIVGKKKGKSAVIGGVVGAGAGYIYGKHRQKKHPKTVTKTKVVRTP